MFATPNTMTSLNQLWTPPSGRLSALTDEDKAEMEAVCAFSLLSDMPDRAFLLQLES